MAFEEYFTSLPDGAVTFDGVDLQVDSGSEIDNVAPENLSDLTLQVNSGEVVLVLGNTTSELFKALFRAKKEVLYAPKEKLRFKNYSFDQFAHTCPYQIIYNDELDVHYPHLTVKQTIDFALKCKFDISEPEIQKLRNDLLSQFGLSHVLDTILGDEFVRGVSGGERKRVSIVEAFIAKGSIYIWDNATKGLDSASALDFLQVLQKMAKASRSINLVKVSQASDNILSKFDKVLMLGDHRQLFFGTITECLDHFQNKLGIVKEPSDCIIEYLLSILSSQSTRSFTADHDSFRDNDYKGKTNSVYISSQAKSYTELDLYNLWLRSSNYQYWKQITASVTANPPEKLLGSIKTNADVEPAFKISLVKQIHICTKRAFQRSLGDKTYLIAQFISVLIQSLVIGSLFYDLPMTTVGSFSRGSLTFFSILFFTFISLSEMPNSFQREPIIKKQANFYFYRRWVETLATAIFNCFFKFLLVIVFSIVLYFLAHLQYDASRFFIFLLFLAIYNFNMVSLFALTSYIAPTLALANFLAGVLLLGIAMYASYVIHLHDMHPWFVWIAYLNPALYAMESILSNELFNLKLDCHDTIVPRGPTYNNVSFAHKACAWQGATLGNDYVRGQDYLKSGLNYSYGQVWRNFGILIGFLCFFLVCSLVAGEYIKPMFQERDIQKLTRKLMNYLPFLRQTVSAPKPCDFEESKVLSSRVTVESLASYEKRSSSSGSCDEEAPFHQLQGNYLKPTKHVVSWLNINYTVEGKKLIDNASGHIASGLTALMGESGAGKTTLLNILSKRTETGDLSGEILIDGKPLDNDFAFKRSIGFVQQNDLHLELLTVHESLKISSELRGDSDMECVQFISNLLNLKPNTLVKNLNPTEKKLLSIGVELVTKPSLLLFLDEPTSGLDADAAIIIVKFLKQLSTLGQAIFCTIHQPSKTVISYFDNLYLLQRGGSCVYFGPLNSAGAYFCQHDSTLVYDKENDNPAEFFIDVVGNSLSSDETTSGDRKKYEGSRKDWKAIWKDSKDKQIIDTETEELIEQQKADSIDYTTSVWKQMSYIEQLFKIINRQWLVTKRDRSYICAKYLLNGGGGLFIGFSFWHITPNLSGLQNTIFFCFMALCVSSPLINQVQDKALSSKKVFVARESISETFHWSILPLAQTIVELPLAITSSTLFFVCAFFSCKFDNSPHSAGVFYLNYILFSAYYVTLGLWLIFTFPTLQTAAVFVAFIYSFTASFCGVMQPYGLFPVFWKFMYRVSPYTYFVDTFVSALLHNREVVCDISEYVPGQPLPGQTCGQFFAPFIADNGGKLKNPTTYTVCGYCTYTVGDDFLQQQNMSYDHIWRNFGIEIAYVFFNVFAMFVGFYLTNYAKLWQRLYALTLGTLTSARKSDILSTGPLSRSNWS